LWRSGSFEHVPIRSYRLGHILQLSFRAVQHGAIKQPRKSYNLNPNEFHSSNTDTIYRLFPKFHFPTLQFSNLQLSKLYFANLQLSKIQPTTLHFAEF